MGSVGVVGSMDESGRAFSVVWRLKGGKSGYGLASTAEVAKTRKPLFSRKNPRRGHNDAEREQWVDNDEGLYNLWRAASFRMSKREFIRKNRALIDQVIDNVVSGKKHSHYLAYPNPTKAGKAKASGRRPARRKNPADKLTPEQVDEIRGEVIEAKRTHPVRFTRDGYTFDILTGESTPPHVNVMYKVHYWNFSRATAMKIAKWLGMKAVFSE